MGWILYFICIAIGTVLSYEPPQPEKAERDWPDGKEQ